MKLEINSAIVKMGGNKRKSYYLKLPKNLVEMFDLQEGELTMEIKDTLAVGTNSPIAMEYITITFKRF